MAFNGGLDNFIKFGFALVLASVALMIWVSSVEARETESTTYLPCSFNHLCTCSKAPPDLGIVQCKNVQFAAIPETINSSKVFMLEITNTGLLDLPPYFLQATGLYKLEISNNPITQVPDTAFNGLERSLWELVLKNNKLISIPSRALRNLQKLRRLDLGGNEISNVEVNSFRGLQTSLQELSLADNSISSLPNDAFQGLPNLETLDLSGNNIAEIDPEVFRDGMNRLNKVILADNLLKEIPYIQLSGLKALRFLDLSKNRISSIHLDDDQVQMGSSVKLALDVLHLEYNSIEMIPPVSFQYFTTVNQTYLDYNPLYMISDDAFQTAKIRELYIRHCKLNFIQPTAFTSLESSLQVLDLSGNNITTLPEKLFNSFDYLRSLSLKDNKIMESLPREMFNGFQYTLFKFDITGENNAATNLQDLRKMRNLRSLALTRLNTQQLSPDDFLEFGVELENLKIVHAGLKGLKAHTFMHVRGLKRLDLSENRIDSIDGNAFQDIGHSLLSLKISHGFSSQMSQIPTDAIKHLTSLQELDFSNNKIKTLSDTCFHFLKNLKILELNDNQIEQLHKGTFQRDIHSNLEIVSLEFNNLKHVAQHTFVDLEKLFRIKLEDNRIERLEKRAFMNLDKLKYLNVRGNKISSISEETFQNLPELTELDLAYNSLREFDFDYFDQVGTLSALKVNCSHNKINELKDNSTFLTVRENGGGLMSHSNIKSLDFSHNNISMISGSYFKPAEVSLTSLSLSNNYLINTSREVFGNLYHLQWLDLSANLISEMDSDSFRYSKKLQVIKLSQNYLSEVPYDIFKNLNDLRIVDFSFNSLKSLPDNLFSGDAMEDLDLSHNQLTKIPVSALSNLAALTLCELDLSHNHIGAIHSMDLSNKFRSLTILDLSHNRLVRLEDAAFATLPRLSTLDLSHNNELELFGRVFIGLENSLLHLSLENISLYQAPDLPLPSLRELIISNNGLPSIPPELAANLSSLRLLDFSQNDLTTVPLITHSLPKLRSLFLAGNPITTLTNTSLLGAAKTLEELDIAHFNLNVFEMGALNKLNSLRSLRISTYPNIQNFNIPKILEDVENLRDLCIVSPAPQIQQTIGKDGMEVTQMIPVMASDLKKEMDGYFPLKLRNITISGIGFNKLAEGIFNGIRSSILHLSFQNTSLTSLPLKIFKHIGSAKNLSIEIDADNDDLMKIPNPNTAIYPNIPENVLLTDLNIHNNMLICDCDLGWVEFWQRKKRQYFCSAQKWSDQSFGSSSKSSMDSSYDCNDHDNDDDLRTAQCTNKNNQNVLEILKTEIECGWGSGADRYRIFIALAVSGVMLALIV